MSVLVTGCAGFIGSNVCRMLLEQGQTVEGVDNLNDAYDPRIKALAPGQPDGYFQTSASTASTSPTTGR